jgi:hypothetical protein
VNQNYINKGPIILKDYVETPSSLTLTASYYVSHLILLSFRTGLLPKALLFQVLNIETK